jgi:hypothetical protein
VLQCVRLQMAYHPNAGPQFIFYRGSKKDGSWGNWALGQFVEKPCAACKKHGDSCLCVVVDDFGDIDLGACVWCKAHSVSCSTAQRQGRGGVSKAKAKADEEPKEGKRKASEVKQSEDDDGEEPLAKRVKSQSVMEDSEEEWEHILDKGEWPEESCETRETEEVREEDEGVRVSSVSDVTKGRIM